MSDDPDAGYADAPAADEPPPEATQFVTTMLNKDYLGRVLVNPTPGTSNAKDFLGRDVKVGNLDYMGRQLVA